MKSLSAFALFASCGLASCTTSEPLPVPSLTYSRTADGIDEQMSYYWDEGTLLVTSPDFDARRMDVDAELRGALLAQFSEARLAIYLADMNGAVVSAPNCPGADIQAQTHCKALQLASEHLFVEVIHPDDDLLDPAGFLFEAPTSLSPETAEMVVLLGETVKKARGD